MIATTCISYSNNDADYVVGDKNLYDLAENMQKKWEGIPIEERQGWKQFMRWYNFWEPRVFPTGDFPNYIDIVREKFEYDEILKDRKFSNLSSNWQALGPFQEPAGNQSGIGRVNAIRFKPGSPNEIWIGAASGGAWITKNNGATWNKIPFTQFLSLGVSDIAFAPSNPQTAYISTGDIFGSASSRNFYSIGVIKTTDGGVTWNVTGLAYELSDNISTSKIMVHPDNENLLLVGSSRGIWKSEDGGITWSQSYNGRAFMDMEMKPDNPNHIVATSYSFSGNSGIFISEDFGESWTIADEEENSNRIAIAFSESNPNIAYAILSRRQFYSLHSFKLTSDGGKTWNTILDYNTHANILGRSQGTGSDSTVGQGQYDLCIAVNPKDHEDVFVGGINTWRSRNAGNSWNLMTHWFGGFSRPYVHADIHDLVFAPDQVTLYNSNDGGIDRINITSGNWQKVDDGLNIMQFYKMNSAPQENNMIVAGAQDNGTSLMEGSNWKRIGGGDGMDCAIDPTNPNIIYFSSQNGNFSRSENRGNSRKGIINS